MVSSPGLGRRVRNETVASDFFLKRESGRLTFESFV